MILSKQFLNNYFSPTRGVDNSMHLLEFKRTIQSYDVFISYSYNDKYYAKKIVDLLEASGYSVYIDYEDLRLDRNNVDEKTAKLIIDEMKKCKGLLYIYSPNSQNSKWCPWEVGVFSGIKDFKCVNLPLVDKEGDNFKNQEYLELYPYINYAKGEFWVCETNRKYVSLKRWLEGNLLLEHMQSL